ncbi:hypothetical protein EYF80_026846 [Liparis tanakae]|uniref:Uncharacterized protein n=1 Tax=Liparis tanakae TaxID=230148 RepID=A0A4Z2HDC8_9TELE|nr:hypothetical protein EYF80_026846 [Liparis tanakae]
MSSGLPSELFQASAGKKDGSRSWGEGKLLPKIPLRQLGDVTLRDADVSDGRGQFLKMPLKVIGRSFIKQTSI